MAINSIRTQVVYVKTKKRRLPPRREAVEGEALVGEPARAFTPMAARQPPTENRRRPWLKLVPPVAIVIFLLACAALAHKAAESIGSSSSERHSAADSLHGAGATLGDSAPPALHPNPHSEASAANLSNRLPPTDQSFLATTNAHKKAAEQTTAAASNGSCVVTAADIGSIGDCLRRYSRGNPATR